MVYTIKMFNKDQTTTYAYFNTIDALVSHMRTNKDDMDTNLEDYVMFECRSIRHEVDKLLRKSDE